MKIADVELEKFMIEGKLKFISDENKSEWKNLITSISNAFSSAASILPESYFGETFTVEQKYYIGRAVCANILAKYKIRNSSKAQKYLGEICQALVLNSEQPELFNGWSIFILDSDEVNAFATSGGHIMLTRGLLKSASSEDELAAVIAHEISHVILGHSIKSIETNKKVSGLVHVWHSAVDAGEKYFSENVNKAFEGFSNTVEDFAFNFIEKGYSQKQEFEADSKALEIMSVEGYNQKAMKTMLENLEANETKSKEMKNHPSAESRLSNVELRLKFLKSESGGEAQRTKRFMTVNKSF